MTTNDPELAKSLRMFRNHGLAPMPSMGEWYNEVTSLGFNFRLTDMQAALGVSQLRKLDRFISRRRQLAARYREHLAHLPIRLPPEAPTGYIHGAHLFAVRVPERQRVYRRMRAAGIGVQVHYVPIHYHPSYCQGLGVGALTAAEGAYDELLSLPLFPDLTEEAQDRVIACLKDAL